eukprot:m.70327 g.70327  ORF g.70327 m.70327 type:complete len:763 (+) comp20068_c0_seq1:336-2624(+)
MYVSVLLGLCALSTASLAVSVTNGPVAVDINQDGSYSISFNNVEWFSSGPTFFRADGKTFSTADGSLKATSVSAASTGRDILGTFTSTAIVFESSTGLRFNAGVRVYENAAIFEQNFPAGANDTSLGETQSVKDQVISSFPSIVAEDGPSRGFVQWSGDMTGSNPVYGKWDSKTSLPSGIEGTGPLCVFTEDLNTSVVISSFSNFMAHSMHFTNQTAMFGAMGAIKEIPANYYLQTIFSLSSGVNKGMKEWGDKLLAYYGKERKGIENDFTLSYIGYSTDNGAFYYYDNMPYPNYEDALIAVKNYSDSVGIPYKWILLDSWWYYKGVGDGVKEWIAMGNIFPHGLDYFYNQTGWLIQGHNRYWATDNVYAKQNGGKWDFVIENGTSGENGKKALAFPLQQEFWDWLLSTSARWGLRVYEQDWLDVEMDNCNYILESASVGRTWLLQMGTAAEKNGMTIQYCMSHCRHIMQSVEIPSVTQARASGDYSGQTSDQWKVGVTSIFAHAVGIAPTKDNYWSTTFQPGSKWGPGRCEPYNRLQAAVSSLSAGPVAPSDKVNYSNVDLIMQACRSDGHLLRPDEPAKAIDAYFAHHAFGSGGVNGEVWATHVDLGPRFSYVISTELQSEYQLSSVELGYDPSDKLMAFEANTTNKLIPVSGSSPLTLHESDKLTFEVFTLAPVLSNGWVLLGEQQKWVSVSKDRFHSLAINADGFYIAVVGVPGEKVMVSVVPPNTTTPKQVSCVIGNGSANQLSCNSPTSPCSCVPV